MKKINILIVDDEQDILDNFAFCLRQHKEGLHFASSGNKAISILKNYKIDVVFSDFNMPDGHGSELYRYIQKTHKDIDFYFFTGNAIEHLQNEDFLKGVFNKPKDISLMLAKVTELLSGTKV
jgi:DNA-binding NtrC family response regulator